MNDPRDCGRPTKAGTPCKQKIYRFTVACGIHANDHDRELSRVAEEAYYQGLREGRDEGKALSAHSSQQRSPEPEQEAEKDPRYYGIHGSQIVEVDGYAYRWKGEEPLAIGDKVLLPQNWVSALKLGPGPFLGTVTALGSTYRGTLSTVVQRTETAEPSERT